MSSRTQLYQELRTRLSVERLAPYELAAGGDAGLSLDLYEWNIRASGALFEVLGAFEVLLRNALHDRLSAYYAKRHGTADPWYLVAPLDNQGCEDVTKAMDRACRTGGVSQGKVVAELSFGFWYFLMTQRYQATIWPAIKPAFRRHPDGNKVQPSKVRDAVERLHFLRNRIAHHEPIFRRNLHADHERVVEVASWICGDTSAWISGCSRFADVVATRPATPGLKPTAQ